MIMIDDTTALVFDTNDLRDALSSDNGVEYVYFGADITLTLGENASFRYTQAVNRGVLARITIPIHSGKRYSTQMNWAVYPVGVQQEGSD